MAPGQMTRMILSRHVLQVSQVPVSSDRPPSLLKGRDFHRAVFFSLAGVYASAFVVMGESHQKNRNVGCCERSSRNHRQFLRRSHSRTKSRRCSRRRLSNGRRRHLHFRPGRRWRCFMATPPKRGCLRCA